MTMPRQLTVAPSTCALPDTPLAAAAAGIDTCVHCGFCLQACPTYVNLEDENDSPRGRIVLMRALLEGTLAPENESVRTHIDRCLGCRACETACPSGVPYGHLLEAARATLLERRPLALVARLVLGIFSRPRALGIALALARGMRRSGLASVLGRRLPGALGFAFAMLEATVAGTRDLERRDYPARGDGARGRVALLEGCVMRGLFRETNDATRRTLSANGYVPIDAPRQGCCGALHAHAGALDDARALARRNIAAFEHSGAEFVVVNAAGCGAMMKEYGHLLADDPEWSARAVNVALRVRDVSELLAAAGPAPGAPLPLRVTYDAPCHLLHAQRVVTPPLAVLAAIPQLELVSLPDADQCCGSAGIYSLVEPATSALVLAPKVQHIAATAAALVATGNPGCLMQIGAGLARAGLTARAVHPVDLLDASYAARVPEPA